MSNGPIDRIVFGDNQFFGINHMSQDKAQERAERFAKLDNIMAVYDHAIEAGIEGIMLNSNDRAGGKQALRWEAVGKTRESAGQRADDKAELDTAGQGRLADRVDLAGCDQGRQGRSPGKPDRQGQDL